MSGFGFGTPLKGLGAARLALQIIGQNVANVNTPGYTRQRVLLGSSAPQLQGRGFFVGTGVEVQSVQRVLDDRLDARIRTQAGFLGSATIDYQRLNEIEGILGEPGDSAVSSLFGKYFDSIGKLRSDPGLRSLRGGMVQSARGLTDGFNLAARSLNALNNDTLRDVQASVQEVNSLATTIADLNEKILTLEGGATGLANDLRDQRTEAVKNLSELIEVTVLERNRGSVDIMVGGSALVATSESAELTAKRVDGQTKVLFNGETEIEPTGGRIAGYLRAEQTTLPGLIGRLDDLAHTLALETNRIHTTGMAKGGPFTDLVAETAVVDGDQDGDYADEILQFGGFPFDIQKGSLFVAVTELSTGDVERTRIDIDPANMTLGDLADAVSAIDSISATVDPSGRLRITAEPDYGFDFSHRLDSAPNTAGTFGGTSATLGGSTSGPFQFPTLPASFQVSVNGGANTTITLNTADFANTADVSPTELRTVLNGKFSAAGISVRALVVGDRLSIQNTSSGPNTSLLITDGANTPAATMGIPAGITATGSDLGVSVSVSGAYTGSDNGHFRFVPEGDGKIGETPGLTIGVFDQTGTRIASLNVGQGYAPGDKLTVGDGVEVAFGPGAVSQTNGDQFALDTLADPDTADVLVALGLNTFFTGATASDISVSSRLEKDPDLLAAGISLLGNKSAQGDSANLVRLQALREQQFSFLDGSDLEGYWAETVSDVGFETRKSRDLLQTQDQLNSVLESQRETVSGVNIDEEMVDLVTFQNAFEASSRVLNVLSDISETLINLGR